MDIYYNIGVLKDELLHCDNLEDLKREILPKLQEQRSAWKQKTGQIMRENHYTGKELAELCKVSAPSVCKWGKGLLTQSQVSPPPDDSRKMPCCMKARKRLSGARFSIENDFSFKETERK